MFCGKCGTKIEDGGNFCPKCGSAVNEQNQIIAVDPAAAANNIDKHRLTVLIIIAVIAAILIKIFFFSSPSTLSGNENNPKKLLKAANSYLSSDECRYQENYIIDYTATDFIGKLGDYYQFSIIGTYTENDKVTEYTEDDDMVIVLTENEDGISIVPLNRWCKKIADNDNNYKSNAVNIILKEISYNYSSGNLIASVDFHNGYSNSVSLTSFELTLFNGSDNPITDKKTYTLNDSISPNNVISYNFEIDSNECTFISDLSNVLYDCTIKYNR